MARETRCGTCGYLNGSHRPDCGTDPIRPRVKNSPKHVSSERVDRKKR